MQMRALMMLCPVALLMMLGTGGAGVAQDGLVGHWSFDDGSGLIAQDASPNALDAEVVNALWARGPFGTALHFGGTNSYVAVPSVPGIDGSDTLTLSAWVYWEGTGQYPNIITGGRWSPGGFLFFVRDDSCSFRMGRPDRGAGDPRGGWTEGGAPLVPKIEFGRWYHLAATLDRPTITTYVDGVQVGTANWDYPVGYAGDLIIGAWSLGGVSHQGLIDDVRVYSRALSAEEIAELHAATAAGRVAAGGEVAPYEIIANQEQVIAVAATIGTRDFTLQIDERGTVVSLRDVASGRELLAHPGPFVQASGAEPGLARVRCAQEGDRLVFTFGRDAARATVRVLDRGPYLTFEVMSVEGAIDNLTFAQLDLEPWPLRSATSGHLTDGEVGVCLRALTIDTRVNLGGNPPRLSAVAGGGYPLVGARAGLVAGPEAGMLPALQAMARNEDVPMSPVGGPFARHAEDTRGSYLFSNVSEDTIDDWIALAQRGGFTTVHFSSWWQSLGHYEPHPRLFPNGMAGLKDCVARVHAAGLKAGMHTLTGCISTNDPWVTPVPDARLKADATYTLAQPMDATSDTIFTVEQPGRHDTIWSYAGAGNAIRIGEELIRYSAISYEEPYGFLNCERGAFGTTAAAHDQGARVDHLLQRYLAFYPDETTTLVGEVADRIAGVYNECGFDQIYQDGSEGMGGWHPMAVMRNAIFERLTPPPILEASAWGHWSWWYHSRIGAWDHSKWGFRISQDLHIAQIPTYREAALLQAQLGWWAVNGPGPVYRAEMPDEMEYFCAKNLAHDAPMSLQGIGRIGNPANRRMSEYLTMTGWYERLRLARYFSDDVLAAIAEPGADYHLRQAADGQWELLPRVYESHVATGLEDGSESWLVANPYATQPAGLRVTALWGVEPYDSERALVLSSADDLAAFGEPANAPGVTHTLELAPEATPGDELALAFAASNAGAESRGAWARVTRRFDPRVNLGSCDALGVWIHGDGKGEVLNIQLANPPEYSLAWAFNLVPIDFEGWRYVELLLRERDPDLLGHWDWPFPLSGHQVVRTPLTRDQVSELTLYLNGVPAGDSARVVIGPIRALPTRSQTLQQAAVTVGGERLDLPVAMSSGSYVEIDPDGAWRLYDVSCDLLQRGRLAGPPPALEAGATPLGFTAAAEGDRPARAEITVIAQGEPLRGMRPPGEIDWADLRYEYVMPALVTALDGSENVTAVTCRPGEGARLGAEIMMRAGGGGTAAYDSPEALTLESFDDLSFFADSPDNQFAKYVFDDSNRGISTKPGVTAELVQSTDTVKIGGASAGYTATSTLGDSSGWSARGRRFAQPLDLSGFRGLGAWVHGDGKGQSLKFQLRDTVGGWCDMYRRIDFTGWRYVEIPFGEANLDFTKVEYLILYYNGIPGGATVTTYIDDIRALPRGEGVRNPSLSIGDVRVVFPVSLDPGDRIAWDGGASCTVRRAAAGAPAETVTIEGSLPPLQPGTTPVTFALEGGEGGFRVEVALVKDYASQ